MREKFIPVKLDPGRPLEMGDKVTVMQVYQKYWGGPDDPRCFRGWEKITWPIREGIFLGYRTLREGIVYFSSDEGNAFVPINTIGVGLVVFNERQNPEYVVIDSTLRS